MLMEHTRTNSVFAWARIQYWIPAIVAAALISSFSTHYFTPEETSKVILPILRWFLPHASQAYVLHLHSDIRKLSHVAEFGGRYFTLFAGGEPAGGSIGRC
jgi:hypothetical protein